MNFLAHLFLSGDDEDLLIGNMIADFLSNKDLPMYSPAVQRGIALHRQIDSYTDQHPIVRKGTLRLQPYHHKYSPVVVDIFYDYFLLKNWESYGDIPLPQFSQKVYLILERRMDEMPTRLKEQLPKMIASDWLLSYGTMEGLSFVFHKLEERAAFNNRFGEAPIHLLRYYDAFNEEFNIFFPEVLAFVKNFRENAFG
ncbi:MAG TPA: DUF479 domain-containing protein [Phaeodactylibacter sp.]|nr:DUF479 domain-containing protein [Phaeodactylibacter sp.]